MTTSPGRMQRTYPAKIVRPATRTAMTLSSQNGWRICQASLSQSPIRNVGAPGGAEDGGREEGGGIGGTGGSVMEPAPFDWRGTTRAEPQGSARNPGDQNLSANSLRPGMIRR